MTSGHSLLKAYYRSSTDEVVSELGSDQIAGLSPSEATKRLAHSGANRLAESHKDPAFIKYLRQYKDLMILLLLASSVISFFLGDKNTGLVLIVLALLNTAIGFFQEYKAERIMESLERLVVPSATVRRGGKVSEIASTDLVPGDIVYIEEGNSVPADLRILTETELSTNDFALTGESNPSRKFTHAITADVELGNRHNLVFMGTTVATGEGYGIVIATGMQTELGRIASLSQDTKKDNSPLQREMNHVATRVTQGTVILSAVLLVIAIKAHLPIKDAFLFAIGIASSLIPQGLPAEINTALAQAANKLAKARALVKKLSAVETLGATSIICTDKTGTLTKNEMTVQQVLIGRTNYTISGSGYEPAGHVQAENGKPLKVRELKDLELFFATGAFASNARISAPDDTHAVWYCLGDPTEGALISLAQKAGIATVDLDTKHPELKEFAFDSGRKRMSSLRHYGSGKQIYVFTKGAPESVLAACEDIWDHGHIRPLSNRDKKFVTDTNEQLATHAMRNLGFAFKVLPASTNIDKLTMEGVESGLTWLGMVSMIDPVREEVPAAMQAAHGAHIRVAIVTGDYATTAQAIALKAGLATAKNPATVVQGEELRKLDDAQVMHLLHHGNIIFSRVSPEDKLRIVGLVKAHGDIVAVTGDGINDAPALKRADIGVAMGKTGTDVAKQSAEIILLDDSFHTLIGAVQQGRTIYQNIKKAALSCFTSNSAELIVNLLSLGAAAIFQVPLAMTVMEILAIDLIAELFPIAALGWDKSDGKLMHEQPRNPKDHIINRAAILDLLWCGVLIGGFAFLNYLSYYHRQGIHAGGLLSGSLVHMKATALTYLTIVLCQLGNILQRRSTNGLFTRYQLHNSKLWLAMALSMFCVFNIIYNPLVNKYFGAAPLSAIDWLYALGAAALFLAIREFHRYQSQHTRKAVIHLHAATQQAK